MGILNYMNPTFFFAGRRLILECLLDCLDLLRASRQHALLQSIELVEAAPCAHLTQTHKDTAHSLQSGIRCSKCIR